MSVVELRRLARSIPKSSQVQKTSILLFLDVSFPSRPSISARDISRVFIELTSAASIEEKQYRDS